MIFLLALYLARTTPNKVACHSRTMTRRLLQLPRASRIKALRPCRTFFAHPLRSSTQKIVSIEWLQSFCLSVPISLAWEVPFAIGKSFHTPIGGICFPKQISGNSAHQIQLQSRQNSQKRNARKMLVTDTGNIPDLGYSRRYSCNRLLKVCCQTLTEHAESAHVKRREIDALEVRAGLKRVGRYSTRQQYTGCDVTIITPLHGLTSTTTGEGFAG